MPPFKQNQEKQKQKKEKNNFFPYLIGDIFPKIDKQEKKKNFIHIINQDETFQRPMENNSLYTLHHTTTVTSSY